jgi:hypothetical protein
MPGIEFNNYLSKTGWGETTPDWRYSKGHWEVQWDTSRWILVSSNGERVFDVP